MVPVNYDSRQNPYNRHKRVGTLSIQWQKLIVSKMLHLNQSEMDSTGHVYCHTSLSVPSDPLVPEAL